MINSLKNKPNRKSRLATHAGNINMLLLLLILVSMTAVSVVIIIRINRDNARDIVRVYSMEAADKFYSYLSRDLTLIQKVAHSKAITAWYTDEEDQAKKTAALNELADYDTVLQGNHFYIVIQESMNEYSIKRGEDFENFVPHARLDPSNPSDKWYFDCIGSDNDYSFKIDHEKTNFMWHMWINHKVTVEGSTVGVFCSGLQVPNILKEIFNEEKYDVKKVRGYLINEQGVIQSDSTNPLLFYEKGDSRIYEESADPGFASALASYKERINGFFGPQSKPDVIRLAKGHYEYAAIEPIKNTDWSVVVFYNGNTLSGIAHLLPLFGVMLVALLIYVAIRNVLIDRIIFTPFDSLIQSMSEGKSTEDDFFGKDRDDEIGDLARIIRNTTSEMRRQEQLLHAVNSTAAELLELGDGDDFEASLTEGLELIGRCVDVDRIHIWQNEIADGVFYYTSRFHWLSSDIIQWEKPAAERQPYSQVPEWERSFLQNTCINGPVSGRPPEEKELLEPHNIKSILVIPLYWQKQFYGFCSFDDCRKERTFTENEIDILRSAGLMIVSTLNRNTQTAQLNEAHERTKLLLNATPLACRLWNRNYEIFDCNDETVKLHGLRDRREFLEKYFDLSPECQPDGQNSREKTYQILEKVFAEGRHTFEWMHQMPDGTPLPVEITLVRVKYGNEDVIAGYTRDLREQKRMIGEIERRDDLLHVMNRTAAVLLAPWDNLDFEASLTDELELIGHCVDVDRMNLWRNETIDGVFYYVNQFQWLRSDVGQLGKPAVAKRPYSENPEWEKKFLRNECINGPVSGLSPEEQALITPQGVKSILAIPLYWDMKFYGFFSFDDYRNERTFSEDDVSILRSAGLMIVSAIIRNIQATQLRLAHEQTQILLETMPLTCNLFHRDTQIFDCNEEAVKMFKMKNKQEYLEKFWEFFPEYQPDGQPSLEKAKKLINIAFDEGRTVSEFTHIFSDGTLVPAQVTLVRVNIIDDEFVAAYAWDMREYKQMMKEIERGADLLNTVNQAATILLQSEIDDFKDNLNRCMGMMAETVGADRVCIWENHTIDGRLYCTQKYEWLGDAESQINNELTENTSYDENIPGWEEVLSQGKCINRLVREMSPQEQAQLSPQGILSLFVAPVFIRDEFWGYVGFDCCHTEKILTENETSTLRSGSILIAAALLRNEIMLDLRNTAVQLENALKVAQEANQSKSKFLASMSHEMRTPLNAVIGLSELTIETEQLDDDARINLEKINSAGETLLSTVNDILDISKIEAGKFELLPVEYDIPSLINDAITQNTLRIGEKPVKFVLNISENLPARLFGDDLRIKQILNNLLSNAFKYTQEGTVELGLSCERADDAVWLTIRISDTGIGILSEDQKKLFADYTQADKILNRKVEGTGLGLSITKNIAEMMDGSITVESEYGKGSVFTVKIRQQFVTDAVIGAEVADTLKNFRYSDHKRRRNSRISRVSLPYARVLVVDDVVTNLDVAKGMMKPYGMQIDCVTSGQEAVDTVREENVRYNAIFMDHMMPEMDGIEAARIIREEIGTEYAKTVPIIALTANAIMGNEEMFLSKGFQAFIPKPIELSRLDSVIRHWVRDKELEKSLAKVNVDGQDILDTRSGQDRRQIVLNRRSGQDRRIFGNIIPGLDLNKGLDRFGGDEESYLQVLHSFALNTRPVLDTMKEVNKDNLNDYIVTVHGIKGSSKSIGADEAGDQAEDLEKAAGAGDFDFISANNPVFIETLSQLITDIEEMLEKTAVTKTKPEKDKPDREVLFRLLESCKNGYIDGVDAAMAEIEAYEYKSDNDLAAWLRENTDRLNLEGIIQRLSTTKID